MGSTTAPMSGFHDFSTLLGNTLETKQGQKPTNEVLADKDVVALYFSAHWCPPCRGFTPQLGKFYDSIKDSKNFEIIFVSSDRDASQFKEYYDEQADWAALPFKDRATKNALSKKIQGKGHSYTRDLGRQDRRDHHDGRQRRRLVRTGSLPLEAALGAGHPRAAAALRRQGGRGSFVVRKAGASLTLLLGALVPALPRLHAQIGRVL